MGIIVPEEIVIDHPDVQLNEISGGQLDPGFINACSLRTAADSLDICNHGYTRQFFAAVINGSLNGIIETRTSDRYESTEICLAFIGAIEARKKQKFAVRAIADYSTIYSPLVFARMEKSDLKLITLFTRSGFDLLDRTEGVTMQYVPSLPREESA